MESDYEMVRELGKGTFGTVYLIKHKTKDEVFALKKVEFGRASSVDQESTEKEAKLMSKLDHDHVVRYVDSYFSGSTLFIFTEYCEGGDLAHFLKDTSCRLPEALIVCWVYQTTSALKYLHSMNILHRDIKPPNIYLSGEADIKLGDLGIARVLDKATDMATTFAGTPSYMSPEIFQMIPYNHKTDIWSFGCVVYELAAGKRAFGNVESFLLYKVVNGDIPRIDSSYSPDLRELVQSMMARQPDERPSASELLQRSPLKEFTANQQRFQPKEFLNKLKTKWGTDQSTVDFMKMLLVARFVPPSTFTESDIRLSEDSLSRYREKKEREASRTGLASDAVGGDTGGGGTNIYTAIMAPTDKVRGKMGEKKQDFSKTEMKGGSESVDRTLDTASVPSSHLDSCEGATTKTGLEAQFLMKQIQNLQELLAVGLGQDTLLKAYSVMDSVTNPAQLEASLVRLIGDDKFREYGDKIMYLRLFEQYWEGIVSN